MNVLQYLVKADPHRVTRFHDLRGNCIKPSQCAEIPLALASTVMRRVAGRRPELPWIPSGARQALAALLCKQSRVLEFGSGMSTLWLARRAGYVHSIEHDSVWFSAVSGTLLRHGVS